MDTYEMADDSAKLDAREVAAEALHTERHAGRRCTMAARCPSYRDAQRDAAVLASAGVLRAPAVPQPVDREALTRVIAQSVGVWGKPAEDAADAVLAVLAGEQGPTERARAWGQPGAYVEGS